LSDEIDTTDVESSKDKRDSFFRDIKKLSQVAFNIRNHYMEDVDNEAIIKAGIVGMLSDLDRFSVLMERSSYDALMESTHGKYEGLGMVIDARDNRIVIISPIEGTPAERRGLRAGDIIWKIADQDTDGMKTSDASNLMRGPAGTTIKLEIKRSGIDEPLEFEVERAVIELKSVNYVGLIPGTDIGYLRLSKFAEETGHELREAISKLNEMNASAMIFDLRNNGGGLLDQAVETGELFVEKGREVVYTKGKYADTERHYYSKREPIFPDKPLVVLVDQGTASASEIVAGAIQDWDRGLIVGNDTYGKGLVQQIFPISNDGDLALKLTTAKYYIPSGRCIQKSETQSKKHGMAESEDEDAEEDPDSMSVSEREVYYTNGGRIVYGGGGIVPDVLIENDTYKPIEINLVRTGLFFDYAVEYVAKHTDVKSNFTVTDEIIEDFRRFIKVKNFTYKSKLQLSLEELEKSITDETQRAMFQPALDSLKALIEVEKSKDFDKSKDYVKQSIKREIVSSIAGERGVYEELVLKDDPAVKKALEIIRTPNEYSRLLSEGKKKAQITND
jgi:carboxyl-terminal processing protease